MTERSGYRPLYNIIRSRLSYYLIDNNIIDYYWLINNDVTYAVLSSYYFNNFYGNNNVTAKGAKEKISIFYKTIFKEGKIVKKFIPGKLKKGPHIFIIRIA